MGHVFNNNVLNYFKKFWILRTNIPLYYIQYRNEFRRITLFYKYSESYVYNYRLGQVRLG